MKKFEQALLEAEQQNKLKRVRLKLDPKIREAQDYSQYEGYEGYVLSETETHIELQIKDKRIMLPKVVLENKLTDFIKGAAKTVAPGISRDAKNLYNKAAQTANYYATDPNVSTATKLGRGAGKAANVAANVLLNPLYTLKAAEKFASAPMRLAGKILGAEQGKNDDTKDFGGVTTFRYTSDSEINIGNTLIAAASAYGGTHVNGATNTNTGVRYYTVLDSNNQTMKSTYMVINAELLAQFPGRTSYNRQKIPIADVQDVKTIANTIVQLKGSSPVTIDSNFYNAAINVNAKLQQSINSMDIDKKNQFAIEVLHLPSLKTFDIGGVLNQKFGDGFVLSEKYA